MALSLGEMSDRFEIQDLLYHYADLIDKKDFAALGEVFTPDAYIDYSCFGGPKGSLDEITTFLSQALAIFPFTQHLNANIQITLDGDQARGRVMCFNPQEIDLGERKQVFMLGLWYVDKYVRTAQGWRISERLEERSWVFNTPEFMEFS